MVELDWSNLSFKARPTNALVVSYYRNGQWSVPDVTSNFNLTLSSFAGVFHYASACIEGLKAFRGIDGKVRIFRPGESGERLRSSGSHLDMAVPPTEMFIDMCVMCVKANIDYLPPYGYDASMYLRPILVGTNSQLGVDSSIDVMLAIMCSPVGTYGGSNGLAPCTALISRNYDRVAPNGTGRFKIAANYAPSLHPCNAAHKRGYDQVLFLDPRTKTTIDEFASSNFFAIKGNSYVTPLSDTILPSITNNSLQRLAEDLGYQVVARPIPVEDLAEFEEVNTCGTAIVLRPVHRIDDRPAIESEVLTKSYTFGTPDKCGPVSQKLYNCIRDIQEGREEDIHNWCLTF